MPPPSSSSSQPPDRPPFPPITRQHSRSSSQLATFAALALSPVSSTASLPGSASPRLSGPRSLSGSWAGLGFTTSPRKSTASSRRASLSPSSSSRASSDDDDDREELAPERERQRTSSGSTSTGTEPTSTSTSASASADAPRSDSPEGGAGERTPQRLKDRRSTFPSVSSSSSTGAEPSPLHLPAIPALTSTSPSPVASPSAPSRPRHSASLSRSTPSSAGPSSPLLRATDAAADPTPAQSSFPTASPSLAQFIQHKRRQASAPYFTSARERSLFSPGAGFSLGPSATSAGGGAGGGEDYVSFAGAGQAASVLERERDDDAPPPPSRSRSRASSRRGTTSGLHLNTSVSASVGGGGGLLSVPGGGEDDGIVVTPTTEEWRQIGEELKGLHEQQRERRRTAGVAEGKVSAVSPAAAAAAVEQQQAGGKAPSPARVKPRWKRWPSLHDDSDDDEEEDEPSTDDDDDDDDDHFALSLSLSRFSRYGNAHQLPHTPPVSTPDAAPASSTSPSAAPAQPTSPERPTYPKAYKSSFSYSSSGGGAQGGFTSHSNTNSLSLSSSASLARSTSQEGTLHPLLALNADEPTDPPGSDPLPQGETFRPTHKSGKSESSVSLSLGGEPTVGLSPVHVHRPALSRGSLSATTGGLSSPSPPGSRASASPGLATSSSATATPAPGENGDAGADGDEGAGTPRKSAQPPAHIPLPPAVMRSLEAGGGAGSAPSSFAPSPSPGGHPSRRDEGAGEDGAGSGLATPMEIAATPFDGDPFASTAPLDAAVPPTPDIFSSASATSVPSTPSLSAPSAPSADSALAPVDLDWTRPLGPVDPRTYSAVTGLRDIESFVVMGDEAGRGAYGSVRRAREKRDGRAVGPELIIKYVIKQRILADCWKKHKILGPIPIEVHVLDHLRRVPYEPRVPLRAVSALRGGRGGGGGKRAQPVRRDSAPRLDLWTGGEGGGRVRTGHPNICGLLDFFEDNEFYMLVMPQATASPHAAIPPSPTSPSSTSPSAAPPLKHGQDLFDYVDAHPTGLPPFEIRRILRQLTDAIWFLHEHSIVHRDIKDENVVLDAEGNVRLIDFGSAAYVKEGRKFDTFSGTLDFAAPEVLKGARYGGKEQDIWALGVLGYVLVCGECPFWSPDEAMRGLSPSTRALGALHAKLSSSAPSSPSPPSLSSSPDTAEPTPTMAAAIDLVERCLEINAADRPSADLVCDHEFLAGEGGWSGFRGWERVGDEGEDGDGGERQEEEMEVEANGAS
ncbi:hypothetical protein JCM10207_003225 [Rhodosporidiobolus poonsookiae]